MKPSAIAKRIAITVAVSSASWTVSLGATPRRKQAMGRAGERNGTRKLGVDKKLLGYIREKQLRADFKKDKRMRASRETIYTYIYCCPVGN